MKTARYPKEERQKRVFKRSKPYSPIPPTKKKKINKKYKKMLNVIKNIKIYFFGKLKNYF